MGNREDDELLASYGIVRISDVAFSEPPFSFIRVNAGIGESDFECAISCFPVAICNLFYSVKLVSKEEYALRVREIAMLLENDQSIVPGHRIPEFLDGYDLCQEIKFYDHLCYDFHADEIIQHLKSGFKAVVIYFLSPGQVGHAELVEAFGDAIRMNGIEISLEVFCKRLYSDPLNVIFFAKKKPGNAIASGGKK